MLKVAQMKVIYEMIGADRSIRGMAEVWVMAWKKGGRNGVVVRGAGGPGSGGNQPGGTVRIGGRVPWGAEVEYAYLTGQNQELSFDKHNSNGKLRYSWAVGLEGI